MTDKKGEIQLLFFFINISGQMYLINKILRFSYIGRAFREVSKRPQMQNSINMDYFDLDSKYLFVVILLSRFSDTCIFARSLSFLWIAGSGHGSRLNTSYNIFLMGIYSFMFVIFSMNKLYVF